MSALLRTDIDDGEDQRRTEAESDLHAFFGYLQSAFEKSTFGPQLERAERLAFDSEGRRIWFGERWSIVVATTDQFGTVVQTEVPIPAAMRVGKSPPQQWAYMPDPNNLLTYATVSRTLLRLAPHHQRVIEAYYGNRGMRWSRLHVGRVFAVYPLTDQGRELIRLQIAREQKEADETAARIAGMNASRGIARGLSSLFGRVHYEPFVPKPEEKPDLSDDDRIWIQWHRQKEKPEERRGKLLDEADEESRYMYLDAKAAYFAAAGV